MGFRTRLVILVVMAYTACHHYVPPRYEGGSWVVMCEDADAEKLWLLSDVGDWQPLEGSPEDSGLWRFQFTPSAEGIIRVQCVTDKGRRFAPEGLAAYEDDGYGGRNGLLWTGFRDRKPSGPLDNERNQ